MRTTKNACAYTIIDKTLMYELMYVIQCMNCKHLCVITTVLVFDSAGIQKWAGCLSSVYCKYNDLVGLIL